MPLIEVKDVVAGYDEVAAVRDRFGLVEADLSHLGQKSGVR